MGDRCLIVEFGQRVDAEINRTARSVADYLLAHPIEGVVDIVPAFTSVAVHYRPEAFSDLSTRDPPHRRLQRRIDAILAQGVARPSDVARLVEVPVCYGNGFGPDLDEVAAACALSPEQVIGDFRHPRMLERDLLRFAIGERFGVVQEANRFDDLSDDVFRAGDVQ